MLANPRERVERDSLQCRDTSSGERWFLFVWRHEDRERDVVLFFVCGSVVFHFVCLLAMFIFSTSACPQKKKY